MRKILSYVVWIIFLAYLGVGYYVNHYMPHGSSYPTGDVVCQNDDRGPCAESYIEDVRDLDIPKWAKFIKRSEGMLLLWVLLFVTIVVSVKKEEG